MPTKFFLSSLFQKKRETTMGFAAGISVILKNKAGKLCHLHESGRFFTLGVMVENIGGLERVEMCGSNDYGRVATYGVYCFGETGNKLYTLSGDKVHSEDDEENNDVPVFFDINLPDVNKVLVFVATESGQGGKFRKKLLDWGSEDEYYRGPSRWDEDNDKLSSYVVVLINTSFFHGSNEDIWFFDDSDCLIPISLLENDMVPVDDTTYMKALNNMEVWTDCQQKIVDIIRDKLGKPMLWEKVGRQTTNWMELCNLVGNAGLNELRKLVIQHVDESNFGKVSKFFEGASDFSNFNGYINSLPKSKLCAYLARYYEDNLNNPVYDGEEEAENHYDDNDDYLNTPVEHKPTNQRKREAASKIQKTFRKWRRDRTLYNRAYSSCRRIFGDEFDEMLSERCMKKY
jgi:hypothetical protein